MFRAGRLSHSGAVRLKIVVCLVLVVALGLGLYPAARYIWSSVHYKRALAAIDRRDFPDAVHHLDICAREWPSSGETRFLAARTCRRAGDLKAAQQLLIEAERLGWVAEAVELERALLSLQLGRFQTISPVLIDLVRKGHPDSLLIVEVLAPATMRNFDLLLAAECLDYWTRLEPDNPQPHLMRGEVLLRLMRKNEALASWRRAVELAPDDVNARLRCGELLLDRKYPDEAKAHFQWLMQRRPDDPAVRRGLAESLMNLGQSGDARKMLIKLLDQQPDDAAAMTLLGQLELAEGNFVAAEKWLQQAAQRQPFDRVVLFSLAECLEKNAKPKEAEAVRQRMKRVEKELDESQKFFKAIARNPGDPEPRCQLAMRLLNNGQESEAIRWLETALRLDPNHIASYEIMAKCYGQKGDPKQAKEFQDRADELRKQFKQQPGA